MVAQRWRNLPPKTTLMNNCTIMNNCFEDKLFYEDDSSKNLCLVDSLALSNTPTTSRAGSLSRLSKELQSPEQEVSSLSTERKERAKQRKRMSEQFWQQSSLSINSHRQFLPESNRAVCNLILARNLNRGGGGEGGDEDGKYNVQFLSFSLFLFLHILHDFIFFLITFSSLCISFNF